MTDDPAPDTARLVARLRDDPLVYDAEAMPGNAPPELTVLIVPQGFTVGFALRDLVMRLAGPGPAAEHIQVVLTFAIPRDDAGRLDSEEAAAAADQAGAVLRFSPPASALERSLTELVQEALPDVQTVSMTDSLATLACDSLSLVEIATRIRERHGKTIDPHDLFAAESLRELAATLAEGHADAVPR